MPDDVVILPADPVRHLPGVRDLCRAAGRRPWGADALAPRAERAVFVAATRMYAATGMYDAGFSGDTVLDEPRILGVAKTHFHLEADGLAPAGHYLGGVIVHPEHRGRGIGSALIRARLDWIAARPDGPRAVHYFANEHNAASIAAHARFGFREVARSPAFHGVPVDTPGDELVLFRRDLQDTPGSETTPGPAPAG